jgi:class 3 adenylate cyclase
MVDDIRQWLGDLGLGNYADAFEENLIDAEVLLTLTSNDLKEIGVQAVGVRRKILNAIAASSNSDDVQDDASTDDATNQRSASAERRQLTVMFCDLVGSTALSRQLDPEDLRDVMRRYQDAVAGAVTRYGGHVAKYLGDGVLAYFGWPQAYEDQAERAVRAGLDATMAVAALVDADGERLAARVGVATGQVVVGDLVGEVGRDAAAVSGETPNLAARLQQIARPGGVVIGAVTHRLVRGSFEMEDPDTHDLKGFEDPVQTWRIAGEAVTASRFDATHGTTLTSFVGRGTEIQLLRDRWELARSGEGQAILISGEPGIGKSRFIAELRDNLRALDDNIAWLLFQCAPYRAAIPFHPITAQIVATADLSAADIANGNTEKLATALDLEPDQDEALALLGAALGFPEENLPALELSADRRRIRTMEVCVELLLARAVQGPTVVVLEDAHWADPTTLETFEVAVDRLADAAIMLIVTHRPEFNATWLSYPHVMTLQLTRLTKQQAEDLLTQLAANGALPRAVLEGILDRTDGVPLFLEELTASILEAGGGTVETTSDNIELPSTLQDSLHARLDRLGEAKVAAQIGAVIGREFDPELLATLMNMESAEITPHLNQLLASGLILSRGSGSSKRLQFKHALVQDVAYGSLLRADRRQLHQRLGELMEQRAGPSAADPALLAHQFAEAGDTPRAKRYWREAMDDAQARRSEHEALDCVTRLIGLLEAASDDPASIEEEMKLQLEKGTLLAVVEGVTSPLAVPPYERAEELASRLGDARYQAYAQFGRAYTASTDINDTIEIQRDALKFAMQHNIVETYAHGYSQLGLSTYIRGDIRGSNEKFEAAWRAYSQYGDGELAPYESRLTIFNYLAVNLSLLGFADQGLEWHQRSLAETPEFTNPYSKVFSYIVAAAFRSYRREADECMDLAHQAMKECEEHRYRYLRPHSELYEAWAHCLMGRGIEKREFLQSTIQDMIDSDLRFLMELIPYVLADILLQAGLVAEAMEALEPAFENIAITNGDMWRAELHRLHAEIMKAAGDRAAPEVEAEFNKALGVARSQETKLFEIRAATGLARFLTEQGRQGEARDLLQPVYNWFTEGFDTPDLKEAKALLEVLS